ncbi:uncharacterized protein BO95DRAFT_479560 [Aspergillus brunneoviolaceus CBS 621.78]|uniref:Uncharacterized protein n=1 Tax=Aspergillus brunneoviolaceus CBS 621.78 TaxID=1450534 RepID=A0ACD1GJK6_9EURO|nr:hypothetical protein BO95DRAFT_479560 [Aspergillus brunneoviolaceus CBS 621.78]RAH49323.1 hypothetical protein BO95DRAFT_479560 [Aspergillus brunneoviolaceus CBS 621.78]
MNPTLLSTILPLLSLIEGIEACYTGDHNNCNWEGSAPACGTSPDHVGTEDAQGRTFVATTEFGTARYFCDWERGQPRGGDCCQAYGNGCWSGYKRLWCADRKC